MGAAALPLMVTSTALSASQQWQAGQNASRSATMAAGQMENNARMAEYSAGQAKGASQGKSAEELRQNRLLQSKQVAIAAASGASTHEKNIADIIANTALEGRLASSIALYEGDLRSDALLTEAVGLRNKAAITRYEGRQARRAANISTFSSALSSASKASSFYGKYGQTAPNDSYGRRGSYDSYSQDLNSSYE